MSNMNTQDANAEIYNKFACIYHKKKIKSEEDKEKISEEFQGLGFFLKLAYFEKKEKSLLFVHNSVINRRLLRDMNIEIIVYYYNKGKLTEFNLNHRKEVYDFDLLPELFAVEIFKEDNIDNNVFLIKEETNIKKKLEEKEVEEDLKVFVLAPSKKSTSSHAWPKFKQLNGIVEEDTINEDKYIVHFQDNDQNYKNKCSCFPVFFKKAKKVFGFIREIEERADWDKEIEKDEIGEEKDLIQAEEDKEEEEKDEKEEENDKNEEKKDKEEEIKYNDEKTKNEIKNRKNARDIREKARKNRKIDRDIREKKRVQNKTDRENRKIDREKRLKARKDRKKAGDIKEKGIKVSNGKEEEDDELIGKMEAKIVPIQNVVNTINNSKIVYNPYSSFRGELKKGVISGKGVLTYENGDQYKGSFIEGKKEGWGEYTFENGDKYIGGWKGGNRIGKGKYFFHDGHEWEGKWKNDQMEGKGTFSFKNGDKFTGVYSKGRKSIGVYNYIEGEKLHAYFDKSGNMHVMDYELNGEQKEQIETVLNQQFKEAKKNEKEMNKMMEELKKDEEKNVNDYIDNMQIATEKKEKTYKNRELGKPYYCVQGCLIF